MEIVVAEQGLFLLPVKVPAEQAKEKAWEQKFNVFGTVSKFLMRPKSEEIQVNQVELRYKLFWQAASHKRFRYDRRGTYHVAVLPDVQSVEVSGQTYAPASGKFTLQGVDHCLLEETHEIFVDGLAGETGEFRRYLTFERMSPDTSGAFPEDIAVVPPQVPASKIVRQGLGDVLQPPSAEQVFEEEVVVDRLDLYYRPVYAFEYTWEAKGKRATVEVDGLTGEFKPTGKTFGAQLKRMMNRDTLFDIGADAAGLIIPGGTIMVKVTKAVIDRGKTKT